MREQRGSSALRGAGLALLWGAALVAAAPAAEEDRSAATPELTIRNSTREPVSFRITLFDGTRPETEQVLAPGSIARFQGRYAFDVTFRSGERRLEYRLDPGADYAFRYDLGDQADLFLGSHGREDAPDLAPYVATPMVVVERMLELAEVGPEDVIYDLGCGDGRIVVAAAERGARGVGVDLAPRRIEESKRLARRAGVEALVEFRVEDATATDFSAATVLTLYLLPESNELLRPIMERRLAPGARVVSHNYEVPGWTPVSEDAVLDDSDTVHHLYSYVIGRSDRRR